ncbi:aminotransferase class V-fold PLP-dependent enzyme [Pseudohongiella sp.]|uniref:Aminotransferase class V domain-containing protein n=1 Tax=marine sediment metagenome TaxID=412755 RepID=A0A0F9YFA3_9ZZZZ|nr:aminotransferase class V-fold PLP-dependent enzyme [Pseudohongiella sp.]HDZ08377.1 aminotransferase class V-fold PLP-dependent enzyme [Pseudohongiella sp.]HEA61902.1 aminotransferase class V-fold PLP-dependent enzyme [Pseudohongiella sp.]
MNELVQKIRDDVIGQRQSISTPFGDKPLVYADYTASGRSLGFVEDYIRQQVLPFYANTHTETTFTGARTSALRESSRQMIRRAVNGTADDKVIFCGSGATAAINKLIDVLNLRLPADLDQRCCLAASLPEEERPVVFIGPYEHHSNELPWRESIARMELIPLDADGGIDLTALERALVKHQGRRLLIGSFSAASNVTGIKTDVAAVTALLKRFGALACWDYAAAGPYVRIDMNAAQPLDAVFLSPHKFVGGPGTPGILIAKRGIFRNRVPAMVGGGTVSYVTPEDHVYIADIERREEGGTPAIVESIRAGLVFSLQQQVGIDLIQAQEQAMADTVMKRLQACANIEVLGSPDAHRLPIFSLRFWHGERELHYGFVVSLLNDLFGIQARGGCSCAGPYAHSLLGMDMAFSKRVEAAVTSGAGLMRPGWVRLNFNYFLAGDELEYLLRALELVAEHGWRLLRCYRYDAAHGVWRHQHASGKRPDPLATLDWLQIPAPAANSCHPVSLSEELASAEALLRGQQPGSSPCTLDLCAEHEAIRWFVLPRETMTS